MLSLLVVDMRSWTAEISTKFLPEFNLLISENRNPGKRLSRYHHPPVYFRPVVHMRTAGRKLTGLRSDRRVRGNFTTTTDL